MKAEEITNDPPWFIALARQIEGLWLVSCGGLLKNLLKEVEKSVETTAESAHADFEFFWSGTEYIKRDTTFYK